MKLKFTLNRLFTLGSFLVFSMLIKAQPEFINPIPIPPLIEVGDTEVHLEMRMFKKHKFNPSNPGDSLLNGKSNQTGIQTWAYNLAGDSVMTILGPTLRWRTGQQTKIRVTNHLNQPTTTHWHGAEVPAQFDGGPHQPIAVGNSWPVEFINLDSASTMWYHPHYHNNTYPHVQFGLSGLIISEQAFDPIHDVLPNQYGLDDIPIIISDLSITNDTIDHATNEFIYAVDTSKSKHPYNLVNGVSNPNLGLPAHLVRLRILNGSTRKGIQFGISDSYTGGMESLDEFILVATDGGYTMKADTMTTLLTGPGARAEIILDLTGKEVGDILYLRNMKELMGGDIVGSPNGSSKDTTAGNAFLQIKIIPDPPGYTPVDTFTPYASSWDPGVADTFNIDRTRLQTLEGAPGSGFTINGTSFDMMTINDTICVGAKEIWTVKNNTPVAHPFHIHKIFFRILDIDSAGTSIDLEARGLNGPKDDILVRKDWTVRFLGKFDDYPNAIDPTLAYMYHCHILTHEDAEGGGMMHQFVVTDDAAACLVGQEEQTVLNDFVLFPNPANDKLYINAKSSNASVIRIIDLAGNVIRRQGFAPFEGTLQIDITGISKGFYIVEWTTKNSTTSRKLLLN